MVFQNIRGNLCLLSSLITITKSRGEEAFSLVYYKFKKFLDQLWKLVFMDINTLMLFWPIFGQRKTSLVVFLWKMKKSSVVFLATILFLIFLLNFSYKNSRVKFFAFSRINGSFLFLKNEAKRLSESVKFWLICYLYIIDDVNRLH